MKKSTFFKKLISLAFVFSISLGLWAQTVHPDFLDGRIYFKVKAQAKMNFSKTNGEVNFKAIPYLNALQSKYQIQSVKNSFYFAKSSGLEDIFLMKFNNISNADLLIKDLIESGQVEYAEKAPLFKLFATPNDYGTTAGNNWHLTKINAQQAWDITTGNSAVKVAVLDNGIYTNHPELINKVVAKIDLGDDDADPTPPSFSTTSDPTWSHGTHTSGLVGAQTNNGSGGISSIGYNVSLIAVKVSANADGLMSAGFEGMIWAADTGANVISMSWGGFQYLQTMQTIVNYAYSKGCVLVAAAGNNGDGQQDPNNTNAICYPAGCEHVIAVGATNGNDVAAAFSEYGDWIDVMAPGGYQNDGGFMDLILNNSVYSLYYTSASGGYGKMQGTSMACPITAGLCGLMLSINPDLTVDELTALLKSSCVNIESLQDASHQGKVGAGRINAYAAVQAAQNAITPLHANFEANAITIPANNYVGFTDLSTGTATSWTWTFEGATPGTSTDQNPTGIFYDTPGNYTVTLVISDGTNSDTETKIGYITVENEAAPSSWITQAAGFTATLRGSYMISIVDPNIVWATGIDGGTGAPVNEFTKTTDGGTTWVPGTVSGLTAGLQISNICALSADVAWIACNKGATPGGSIWKTEDGGVTWTQKTTTQFTNTSSAFPNFVHFFNDLEGVAMGDPVNSEFEIYTTSDGGNTWNAVAAADIPNIMTGEMGWTNVFDVVGDNIWFGTNKGRVYKSVNKGATWTVQTPSLIDCNRITFNDANNGLGVRITWDQTTGTITFYTLKKTTDGGATWQAVTPTGAVWKGDVSAIPGVPGMFVAVGSNGAVQDSRRYGSSFSTDFGATWTHVDTAVQYINCEFYDVNTGWASGFCTSSTIGGIYKWDPTVVGIKPTPQIAQAFDIYPNPTKGIVNLNLPESCDKQIGIEIYDMMGKKVYQTRTNISKNGATSLNVSQLNKGMYLISVISGNATSTQRIIVE